MKSGFRAFFVVQCAVVVPFVTAQVCLGAGCPCKETNTINICPGMPHSGHPSAKVHSYGVRNAASCAHVADKIRARIAGNQDGSWSDPQNGGQYSLLDSCHFVADLGEDFFQATVIKAQRSASPFTDLINFILYQDRDNCDIFACSTGQDASVEDLSRNYCNIRNLLDDFQSADISEQSTQLSCPQDCNGEVPWRHTEPCDCWCPNRGLDGECSHDGGSTADAKMCIASLESVV